MTVGHAADRLTERSSDPRIFRPMRSLLKTFHHRSGHVVGYGLKPCIIHMPSLRIYLRKSSCFITTSDRFCSRMLHMYPQDCQYHRSRLSPKKRNAHHPCQKREKETATLLLTGLARYINGDNSSSHIQKTRNKKCKEASLNYYVLLRNKYCTSTQQEKIKI